MALRLTGPHREELGSKGEMWGTHSRGVYDQSGGTRKGRSMTVVASGETTIARALRSKGEEGRQGSGGVVDPGGGRGRGLFIGAENGELRRRWWW
jgi:hypothetical protein